MVQIYGNFICHVMLCHLEICDGTEFDRRCLRVDDVMGRVIFWRRMTQKTATVTSRPEVHLPDASCGGSPNYSGCNHVNCGDCE